ncbi:MAG: hypothetical protein PHZ11_03415 [Desulfitobacteriaceae bacterium]|nr:hypothetical protein [Desulfitobacteriaceae bacterium]MDD4345939.1 hypothetical protein [Desulfitobacteriaceae bacterium]MDD4401375.1 hypothetical protein [Desulfitobacteriaceae bacterium]
MTGTSTVAAPKATSGFSLGGGGNRAAGGVGGSGGARVPGGPPR